MCFLVNTRLYFGVQVLLLRICGLLAWDILEGTCRITKGRIVHFTKSIKNERRADISKIICTECNAVIRSAQFKKSAMFYFVLGSGV